ncbi:molybdopterin-guanine dinucleotide biosynthesis protein B [Shouchella patagoniensis]|uniref:molybdopterin-guanine dinucleotide biosynthesis protein B n=1 Tax=Shouchella patagoniensis TaxID=228576 RepID=UPI000994A4AC|nr:molybdopterin-guanine dinucleotide biosynthesis protein B [Shouchella patagoniensis]
MGKVFQVIGYKNSGKTTLVEELIQLLIEDGLRVATLKHHGHGGIPLGSTDSDRFSSAGAISSIVEGDGVIKLVAQKKNWALNELVQKQFILSSPDIILVEGWKNNEAYGKVVLLRGEADLPLLQLTNVRCAISIEKLELHKTGVPIFNRSDKKAYQTFIRKYIQESESEIHVSFNKRAD